MKATPKLNSILELIDYFKDEETCLNFFIALRWKDGITCPHCEYKEKIYKLKDGTFKCSSCLLKFSARKDTFLEDSKLPLRVWIIAMYLCAYHSKGISSVQLSKDLNITQKSAWFMLHRIRFAFRTNSFEKPLENIVEMDETFIGGKEKNKHKNKKTPNNQGRSLKTKTTVIGMVERKGEVRAFSVTDVTYTTIKRLTLENIKENSIVYTDEYRPYRRLKSHYTHSYVVHSSKSFVEGDCHTNTIEGFWSLVKRCIIGIYHYVSPKHLQNYLEEFAFRYNHRHLKSYERFELLLSECMGKLSYKRLTE